MAFELENFTKARVLDVRTLTSKDRKPDDKPGAQVLLRAQLPVAVLAMFDGFLPGMLYRAAKHDGKGQAKLDGMESAELTSIGAHVKRLKWEYEQTGCDIVIDRGLGGRSNVSLSDCKVYRVSFHPQQGGSVQVLWTIDAPGLTDDTRGKLSGMKSTDIELTIALPEPAQDDIDAPGRRPPKSAGPVIDGSKGHPGVEASKQAEQQREAAGQASKEKLDASGRSPFPKGGAKSDGEATEEFLRRNGKAEETEPAAAAQEPASTSRRQRRAGAATGTLQ